MSSGYIRLPVEGGGAPGPQGPVGPQGPQGEPGPQGPDTNIILNVPCETIANIGDAVRMSSGIAVRAQADNETNANFIGIIESKPSSALANIRINGLSSDIFSSLTESSDYYLSAVSPGQITDIPPSSSGNVILRVGQAFSSTKLIVLKGLRIVLS